MNMIFTRESEQLKENILRLAGEVELRLADVFQATDSGDKKSLQNLIDRDEEIDAREVQIEEECLKILALHQPVAKDLRFVVAVLKINNDLERIGDIVVNIAARSIRLIDFPLADLQEKLMRMGNVVREMLKESLDALISLDIHKAVMVIARDDEVDRMKIEVIQEVIERATPANSSERTESLILIHNMARDLERIGDHATNIAEDVAYLVDGTIIRHQAIVKNRS